MDMQTTLGPEQMAARKRGHPAHYWGILNVDVYVWPVGHVTVVRIITDQMSTSRGLSELKIA